MTPAEQLPSRPTGVCYVAKTYGQRRPVGVIERPGPEGNVAIQVYLVLEGWWCEERMYGEIEWATSFAAPENAVFVTEHEKFDPDAAINRMLTETSMLIKEDVARGREWSQHNDAGAFTRHLIRFEVGRFKLLQEAIAQYGKSDATIDDFLKGNEG